MKRHFVFVLLGVLFMVQGTALCAQSPSKGHEAAIRAVMQRQEDAWNRGDLKGFMNGYWESDSLKFIGKTGVTYGWKATLARYEKGYPDKAAMGTLAFDILHVEFPGKNLAVVVGKWTLKRAEDEPNGHFSLLWKRIKGNWVIVMDHSS